MYGVNRGELNRRGKDEKMKFQPPCSFPKDEKMKSEDEKMKKLTLVVG